MAKTRKATPRTQKPLKQTGPSARPQPGARLDTGEGTDDGKIVNQPPIVVSKKGGPARQPRTTAASTVRPTTKRRAKTSEAAASMPAEPKAPWKRDTRSVFKGSEHTKPADIRGVIRAVDGRRFTARQPGRG